MRNVHFIACCLLLFFGLPLIAQEQSDFNDLVEKPRDFRVMFYNCENLFDTINDPLKDDDEYTPRGERYWTSYKYYKKNSNISKSIIACGGWRPVDLVGLCEVENRDVLLKLTKSTPLYKYNYNIVHYESPDMRGIDVALLYRSENFELLTQGRIDVSFLSEFTRPTRDILYVKGIACNADTIHVFVNHWPSRWGGQLESEEKRKTVARILKSKTDSIHDSNARAKIIIMGDMNDEAHNTSLKDVLCKSNKEDTLLYNLGSDKQGFESGTHKYQGTWSNLDHFIVSKSLFDKQGLHTNRYATIPLRAEFLLERDERYLGLKPFRSFIGYSYNGGYSDHLPVFVDFYKENPPK